MPTVAFTTTTTTMCVLVRVASCAPRRDARIFKAIAKKCHAIPRDSGFSDTAPFMVCSLSLHFCRCRRLGFLVLAN